ncbi:hypothetical protein [Catenulispora pinisilvae]|uniref:hypothetical protein n=1 Tax=Catenulispora pinisilvae TaxID=2705253 RepID=UPI0018927811|nr:hypothetical protein [Catenulispora pinisilvae]
MATGVAQDTRAAVPFEGGDGDVRTAHSPGGWLPYLGAALLLGVFIPLAYAALSGNLGIPHNDTWAFGRSAQDFVHTGQVRMYNWNMMGLAGLVVLAWPVGASLAAQSVFIAGIAVVGLLACYDALIGVLGPDGRRRAALGTLAVALWPGFALLSTSFMTDIPAFAAIAGTLALGRRALDRASLPWLAGACAVGLWGATVREQVIAAPGAVLIVALFRARYRADRGPVFRIPVVLGVGVLVLAVLGTFELWRRKVPGGSAPDFTVRHVTAELVSTEMIQGLLIVALTVSPVVFAVVRPRGWSWRGWSAAGVTLVASALVGWDKGAFLGNYVTHVGAYPSASSPGRPILLGSGWWMVLAWVAYVAAALLVGSVVERVRTDGWTLGIRPEMTLFAAATVLGTLMEVGQGRDIYDRYLIPMAIPALALLMSGRGTDGVSGPASVAGPASTSALGSLWAPKRIVPVVLAAGMVTVTSATLMANAFSYDKAVWNTATRIVASGAADARHVDAGLVWDGYHSPTAMTDHPDRSVGLDVFGGLRYLPNHFVCYMVTPSSHPGLGWELVSEEQYKTYGVVGDSRLYVWRVTETQTCSS